MQLNLLLFNFMHQIQIYYDCRTKSNHVPRAKVISYEKDTAQFHMKLLFFIDCVIVGNIDQTGK